ncbi:hypothetical protein COOONC_27571 [Cooperia oncophora]
MLISAMTPRERNSLIHNDSDLSDQAKFEFLKQALKGKAAASNNSIPVMGEYPVAVKILKKHYDISASTPPGRN